MEAAQQTREVQEISDKLEKSLGMEDKMEVFHRLVKDGKDAARQGDMIKARALFKKANKIHPSEKLERRIQKIEEFLAQNDSPEEEDEFVDVNGSGLMLFKELYEKLYEYQRNGVAFLYSLYRDGLKGGILADDMGLGKTIQVISFLSGMFDNELARHALLVMPTSLITNWTKEFAKWTPGMRVKEFHGSVRERTHNLEKVQGRSGVVITTYTMLMNNWQQLSSYRGREFTWDYLILDEAHKIKSPSTKTAKSATAIPSKNRVLLTGTPVQNNLKEMWALFDFACQGSLLGTAKTFKSEYENPITRAREKDSTPGEKALGSRMSENLMAIIKPYFLRRTKAEVNAKQQQDPNPPEDAGATMPTLTRKNDLIVWTYLSPVQEDIYRQFLSLDHIKELLMTTRSPLAELNIMKKLCDHPRLLSAAAISKLGLEESAAESQQEETAETDTGSIANVPDSTLISESGKLVFLFHLLERLREEGHRTLVFAHYRKVLDIIQRILGNRGFKVLRLDGTITQIAEREKLITAFQQDKSYTVFLLTTQVGGVGITLTAADRVVIYDPSWNPATDAQAVDRAYRIGQTENVVIYRLITCGTVEEKIYRRQVFKDSLIRQNTGDKKNPFRYFSKQELKELFILEDARSSTTQLQLQALHSRHRHTDPGLDEHIARLHAMEIFGISDHDLMFSLDINHDEAPEDQEAHHYIEGRVQKAQELMKAESELKMQLTENMASSTEPAWLRPPVDSGRERPRPSYPQHDLNSQELSSSEDAGAAPQEVKDDSLVVKDDSLVVKDDSLVVKDDSLVVLEDSLVVLEDSDAAEGDVADVTVEELTSESAVVSAGDNSLEYVTENGADEQLNGTSHSTKTDSERPPAASLQNKRLSLLQASNSSFRADASPRASPGVESFQGNFKLQLEDSDMFSDLDVLDQEETEAEERELLSQLQGDGAFDINKSLCERQHEDALNSVHKSEGDESMSESIVAPKRKRVAMIYDSDEEEEEDDDEDDDESHHKDSFQVLGASTPKSEANGHAPLRSRKSAGGNGSVASSRSVLRSIIDDMDIDQDTDAEEEEEDEEEEEEEEEEVEDSGRRSDEAEEDDIIDPTYDALQLEETTGETLNTEGEEEEEEEEEEQEEQEMNSNLEESTNEMELASDERMDQCTVGGGTNGVVEGAECFEALVRKGKEFHSDGKLDDALEFFLRAIDLKPGDPEVQFMTIQLYRQLSKRS